MAQAVYGAEMRFGVVMYGGVSLAIYINGVTSELFELACATPIDPAGVDRAGGDSTREIYRRLSLLAASPALRGAYAQALAARPEGEGGDVWVEPAADSIEPTRFVVDVISGSSAGGINGIFLAKALANAESLSGLAELWIAEGDIGRLLNDARAQDGLPPGLPRPPGGPASLLSSDRMFLKLHEALQGMAPLVPGAAGAALADELDLFVTATDIDGAAFALRLFDKVVFEKRYRQRFHFSVPSRLADAQAPAQDFGAANHAFLAYAARCTSSFPFAFEPMTLRRASQLLPAIGEERLAGWRAYFDALPPEALQDQRYVDRPYGDGGYLDNKPFSYVVEALSERFGDVPAQRKLLYVEPDPEMLDPGQAARMPVPDAVGNAVNALVGIPRYETIREDLQAILLRNRRIERVERILRLAEADVERTGRGFSSVRCIDGRVPDWSRLALDRMVEYYGEGFLPYRRLRVYAVTDWLAAQLAAGFGIDAESDRGYALRAVVRAWRESRYADNPPAGSALQTVNAFLEQFDLDYRLRRLGFLLRRIDLVIRLLRAAPGDPQSELEQLVAVKVARSFGAADPLANPAVAPAVLALLRRIKQTLRALYRQSLALRRRWADGEAVAPILGADPQLEAETLAVLDHLIRTSPCAARPRLRCVDGSLAEMPADSSWLQSNSASIGLQDSVMARVDNWLAASAGRPELTLWATLERALAAVRLTRGEGEPATEVSGLLFDVWQALGRPRLEAFEIAAAGPDAPARVEARLEVDADAEAGEAGLALRRFLGEYFLAFDSYDQTRFTLYYGTAIGEPALIDVIRVSPVDALTLRANPRQPPKLAGNALAHFGAFLDAKWRRNDIMWGRLDGAERLIHSVLPADDDAAGTAVRAELIRLAQGRILKQTLGREASAELSGLLVDALRETGAAGSLQDRLRHVVERLDLGDDRARARLAGALTGLLDAEQLIAYVSTQPTFDPRLAVDTALANASRAVTITGRILEGVSRAVPSTTPLVRWVARLGLVMQGAVVVATPGAIWHRVWSHLMILVYGFEVLLLGAALLFGGADTRATAVAALVVTLAIHLAKLVLGDFIRGRRVWQRGLLVAAVLALLGAAGVGTIALWQWGPGVLCGPADGSGPPGALAALCRTPD
ncbi:MAG: patatin-like protein [Burkholderiales bacterium]|nr:patatin-like protein [Burkholderiales bacterium]